MGNCVTSNQLNYSPNSGADSRGREGGGGGGSTGAAAGAKTDIGSLEGSFGRLSPRSRPTVDSASSSKSIPTSSSSSYLKSPTLDVPDSKVCSLLIVWLAYFFCLVF